MKSKLNFREALSEVDRLSQANVLLQLENIKTYPIVKEMLAKSNIKFHAWWFDLSEVKVYCFNEQTQSFELSV